VVLSLAVVSVIAFGSPTEPQPKSAKELVREAQTDEQQGHWESALEKLKTASKLKHKDKTIAQELEKAKGYLADRTANQAIGSCNALKIDTCEQQIKLALSYASTKKTSEAQNQLAARKAELQKRWDHAEQMISSSQLEDANVELEGLSQFPYLFPPLAAEKERLRHLRINADVELGTKDLAADQFDEARKAFSAAQALDPSNAEAARGIDAADKGKQAFHWNEEAKKAFSQKNYEDAFRSNQNALDLLPAREEFLDLKKQISAEWLKLLEDARGLSPDPNSLKGNQTAWENLEWIQRLDPHYQRLEEATRRIKLNLYSIYNQEANKYQLSPNNSGIAIAYLYFLNAQRMNREPRVEDPFAASFSEVKTLFTRKRAMLVLVNVVKLTPVSSTFSEVVEERVRAAVEGLGLPDLKVALLDEYEKNPPAEDPLFQDNRPDGKSRVALVQVKVTNYEMESSGNNVAEDKPSKFISGQETVTNPEYEKTVEQFRAVSDSLSRNKKKNKPTKEGYTSSDLAILQQKMAQTPPTITRDKTVDYTYQEYHLNAKAHIVLKLEVRDMLEKRLLGSDEIESTEQEKATEIAGVHASDVNGLINRQARIMTPEQLARDAELDALKAVDAKVPTLLANYVHRYYKQGERALGEGRPFDAVENFICYWYTFRGQMDEKRSQHIRDVVRQNNGIELDTSDSLLTSP
jgi:hypothetical protein